MLIESITWENYGASTLETNMLNKYIIFKNCFLLFKDEYHTSRLFGVYVFVFISISTFKEMFIKEPVGRRTLVTMKVSNCLSCKSCCWGLVCKSDNVRKWMTSSAQSAMGYMFHYSRWIHISLQLSWALQRISSQWDHEAKSLLHILLNKESFNVWWGKTYYKIQMIIMTNNTLIANVIIKMFVVSK